jgi:hypothetical protein
MGYRIQIGELLRRLCADKNAVISFEYVAVAACIAGAATAVFSSSTGAGIAAALTGVFTRVLAAIATVAVGI